MQLRQFRIDLTGATLVDGNWALAGRSTLDSSNSIVFTELGTSGVDARWQRDWYVDTTGTFAATLAFNFSDADLTNGGFSDFALLFRDLLTDDYSVINVPAQLIGDTITFQLPSGQLVDGYYTLGLVVPEPSTACLAGLGLALLAVRRRRRR